MSVICLDIVWKKDTVPRARIPKARTPKVRTSKTRNLKTETPKNENSERLTLRMSLIRLISYVIQVRYSHIL